MIFAEEKSYNLSLSSNTAECFVDDIQIIKSILVDWGEVSTELIHILRKWIQEAESWTIPDWSAITHSSQGYILLVKRVQQQDIPFT